MDAHKLNANTPSRPATLTLPDGKAFPGKVTYGGDQEMFSELYDSFKLAYKDLTALQASLQSGYANELAEDEDLTFDGLVDGLLDHVYIALNEGLLKKPDQGYYTRMSMGGEDARIDLPAIEEDEFRLPYIPHFIVGDIEAIGAFDLTRVSVVSTLLEAESLTRFMPGVSVLPFDHERAEDEGVDVYDLNPERSVARAALKIAYADAAETHGLSEATPFKDAWPIFASHLDEVTQINGLSSNEVKGFLVQSIQRDADALTPDEVTQFDIVKQAAWLFKGKGLLDAINAIPGQSLAEVSKTMTDLVAPDYLLSRGKTVPSSEVNDSLPDITLGEQYDSTSLPVLIDGVERNIEFILTRNNQHVFAAIEKKNDGTSTVYTPGDETVDLPLTAFNRIAVKPPQPERSPDVGPDQPSLR